MSAASDATNRFEVAYPRKHASHYCLYCGLGMTAKEDRDCGACDGDSCVPRKYLPLRDLKPNHPRVQAEMFRYVRDGCRHRPKCMSWKQHMGRCR